MYCMISSAHAFPEVSIPPGHLSSENYPGITSSYAPMLRGLNLDISLANRISISSDHEFFMINESRILASPLTALQD